jgi:hypothetical protein
MTVNEQNRRLQTVFMFQAADLRANREGRLSRRQQAVRGAARSTSLLALVVFAVVMLSTLGILALSLLQTPRGTAPPLDQGMLTTVGIVGAVLRGVFGVGLYISRPYSAALGSRLVRGARGRAAIAEETENNWQITIGPTWLRLPDPIQLAAFEPGTEYEVYYLAGPVPTVLSAAVARPGADAPDPAAEPEAPVAQDAQVRLIRRGGVLVVLIGLMAVQIPLTGILTAVLPDSLRVLVNWALLAEGIGFVVFALWWLSPRR